MSERIGIWPAPGKGQWLERTVGPSLTSPKALDAIVEHAPQTGIFVEVGTWGGATAAWIATQRPNLTVLSVDHFVSDQHRMLWLLNRRPNMQLFMGPSTALFAMARESWAAGVFIDGDHRYEGALADLRGAARIILPNAPILVHDYGHTEFPGVAEAVRRFCDESTWRLATLVNELAILTPGG